MSVTNTHPHYDRARFRWELIRDCSEGEESVKKRDLGAYDYSDNRPIDSSVRSRRYLPDFDPPDASRYAKYVQRAYFLGVTGRTRDALSGMIFRKPPIAEIPDSLQPIVDNADGAGQSLEQVAKAAAADLLELGRYGLLVDFPSSDPGMDAETEARMQLRPVVLGYRAENIINWRTEKRGGVTVTTLVVLLEQQNAPRNEFDHHTEDVYRVLRLEGNTYTQTLYNREMVVLEQHTPRMAGGATFDHIPFYIIGAQDNKPDVDESPLYDLAVLNIAHYRNVADLEESGWIAGQPTLHVDLGETNTEFWQDQNPNGVTIGARRGIVTQQGGTVNLVQAEERSLLLSLKQGKEEEMVKIGARLIQRGAQAETAEAARINASAEASTLDMLVNNLSEGLQACLRAVAQFMGVPDADISYKLNTDFWEATIDPQTAMAIIQFGDAGIIAKSDQRHMIRQGRIGLEDGRTDEEIDAEVQTQPL